MDKLASRLSRRIIYRFLAAVGLYLLAVLAVLAVGMIWSSSRTWYPEDFLYRVLLQVRDYLPLVVAMVCVLGFLVLLAVFWRKTLGYLATVIEATRRIHDDSPELIALPPDLEPVEAQMNQIKLDVRATRERAREAEQRKNDLVVYLAHDLKTPLTSVIGYLSLLRDEPEISETLREKYTSVALTKAERLEDLINEFFEITRFNLTHIELEVGRVNLSRMLEQIAFEFKPMLDDKRLRCALELPPEELSVRMDADKMQRVFDNLLRNAISYGFEGTDITIEAGIRDGAAVVRVTNHGDTIPSEKLGRIFERFYRLDSARASVTGGAGLGLSIAKQIVELHGGTLTAASAQEVTTFTVRIPI